MNVQAVLARPRAAAEASDFARDVIAGLTARPKALPPKYFYDEAGSQLFERITELPEYYPTRCELSILREHATDIAGLLTAPAALIELGSGSTRKARILLDAAAAIRAYVPVDISAEMLAEEAARLAHDYPQLEVEPVAADFTRPFSIPRGVSGFARAGFFPGSTIGNFEPADAVSFLQHVARVLGRGASLIIGVDLIKDIRILNAAYDDSAGVTAQFNLNLLRRINRELGANFDIESFAHEAFYNAERHRIEMHLRSKIAQRVTVPGRTIVFDAGETIHTESSYKYTFDSFEALAQTAGWSLAARWTDSNGWFSVQALVLADRFGP
jgi:dimethylhistidine N-methyltransferase